MTKEHVKEIIFDIRERLNMLKNELKKEPESNISANDLKDLLKVGEKYKIYTTTTGSLLSVSTSDGHDQWSGSMVAFSGILSLEEGIVRVCLIYDDRMYTFTFNPITDEYILIKDDPYYETPQIGMYYKIKFEGIETAVVKTTPILDLDKRYKVYLLKYESAVDKTCTLWLDGNKIYYYVFYYDKNKGMWEFVRTEQKNT